MIFCASSPPAFRAALVEFAGHEAQERGLSLRAVKSGWVHLCSNLVLIHGSDANAPHVTPLNRMPRRAPGTNAKHT